MGKSSWIATILGMTVIVWGCGEPDARFGASTTMSSPPPAPAPAVAPTYVGPSTGWLVPEAQLKHLGLETFWTGKLPVQPSASVIDAYVLGDILLLESAERRLYAVDRKTGVPKWTVEIPNRCDFRACEDDSRIYVPCRNVLVAVDKRGFVVWRNFLEFAPGGVPVADADHVYLPCFDGRVRAFLKESGYFAWQYTTKGEMESRPALGARMVYAGSNDGTLYALTAEKLDLAWSFKTYGPIRGGVVYDKFHVFAASTDGSLYCLNGLAQPTREQQLAWNRPFATGAAIDKTPYVGDAMVLVVNRNRECFAVERDGGRKLWTLADVDTVLTQGKMNTYFLRHLSRIVAADTRTGAVRWEMDLPVGAFAFVPTNTEDDVLYLVKTTGETQAIRELRPAGVVEPAKVPVPAPAPAKEGEAPAKPDEGPAAAE